jgi:hypothetical protein
MLAVHFIGQMIGCLLGSLFSDFRNLTLCFILLTLPFVYFFFTIKPTPSYLIKENKKKEFCDLINYIIKQNEVSIEFVKNEIKFLLYTDYSFKESDLKENLNIYDESVDHTEKVLEVWELECFFNKEKVQKHKVPLGKYFCKCKNFIKLIGYLFLIINLYWVIGNSLFLPEMFDLNSISLNALFLAIADFIGILFSFYFLNRTKRNTLNIVHLLIVLVSCLILTGLSLINKTQNKWVFLFDVFFSCKGFDLS